jgi:hypothetical protein
MQPGPQDRRNGGRKGRRRQVKHRYAGPEGLDGGPVSIRGGQRNLLSRYSRLSMVFYNYVEIRRIITFIPALYVTAVLIHIGRRNISLRDNAG